MAWWIFVVFVISVPWVGLDPHPHCQSALSPSDGGTRAARNAGANEASRAAPSSIAAAVPIAPTSLLRVWNNTTSSQPPHEQHADQPEDYPR